MDSTVPIPGRNPGPGRLSSVYPAFSRRSGGLSVGVDLFTDAKTCTFDCPYCEVFPFDGGTAATIESILRDLDEFFDVTLAERFPGVPLRDLCVSGSGEPTCSPLLGPCLSILADLRRRRGSILSGVPVVLITNGTGFPDPETSRTLALYVARERLEIWAKFDAGTQELFGYMSGSAFGLEEIETALVAFARTSPLVVQSMICAVDGRGPDEAELRERARRISGMLSRGARIAGLQLYTVSRTPCRPGPGPLRDDDLLEAARAMRPFLPDGLPVSVFGGAGRLPW